jgi:hypothetical protein
MLINSKQLKNVSGLDRIERYTHTISFIVDWEKVCITNNPKDNTIIFPSKEYATYNGYKDCNILSLYELIENLKINNYKIIVFPSKDDDGFIVNSSKLVIEILDEMEKY